MAALSALLGALLGPLEDTTWVYLSGFTPKEVALWHQVGAPRLFALLDRRGPMGPEELQAAVSLLGPVPEIALDTKALEHGYPVPYQHLQGGGPGQEGEGGKDGEAKQKGKQKIMIKVDDDSDPSQPAAKKRKVDGAVEGDGPKLVVEVKGKEKEKEKDKKSDNDKPKAKKESKPRAKKGAQPKKEKEKKKAEKNAKKDKKKRVEDD